MSVLQGIDDFIRTLGNAATFGLPDYLEGEGAATRSAAARERLGIVGDVGAGAATLLPVARGAQAFQQLARLARPAAAAAAAPILGTAARIRAAPVRYAAGGAALAGMERGARTGPDSVAVAVPAAVTAPAARRTAPRAGDGIAAAAREAYRTAGPTLTPFQRQLQAFAAQSGGISLNELAALAQAENQARPAPTRATRTPTGRDIAAGQIIQMADQMFAARAAQAQELAATDPAAGQRVYASAVAERMAALQGILGQNPINEATAQGLRERLQEQEEE